MSSLIKKYTVDALDVQGNRQRFDKEAHSEQQIAIELASKGYTPIAILEHGSSLIALLNNPIKWHNKPRYADLAMFAEHMAEMLQAGMTVEQSLRVILRSADKPALRKMVEQLLARIKEGVSLSNALAEYQVDNYLVGMVKASEQSGQMAEVFSDVARYLQRIEAAKSRLVSTLIYPCIILITVIFVLGFVFGFVIPQFAPIFEGEVHLLPWITRLVLYLSAVITGKWQVLIIAVASALAMTWLFSQNTSIRKIATQMTKKLPIVEVFAMLDIARTLNVMGTLIRNGVELSHAMVLSANTASSQEIVQRIEASSQKLREGVGISEVFQYTMQVPSKTLSIIEVGEHTGELGKALIRAAHLLETDSEQRLNKIMAMINPISIALLGLIVGGVVAGVMLGILSINQLAIR